MACSRAARRKADPISPDAPLSRMRRAGLPIPLSLGDHTVLNPVCLAATTKDRIIRAFASPPTPEKAVPLGDPRRYSRHQKFL
jgi:hypothetical protein